MKFTLEVEAEPKEIAALLLEAATRHKVETDLDFVDAVQLFTKVLDNTLKRNSVL